MRFRRRTRPEPVINLTSLIDILFTVLVFLVLTTTFHESSLLRLELPHATSGEALMRGAQGRLRVDVAQDGRLSVGERPFTLGALAELLAALPSPADAHVLLAADEGARHGRVVEVMDAARRAGVSRISIETLHVAEP